jgi:hypothetical protein
MCSAGISLVLLIFPVASTLAAGSKAKFTEQARFTDTLSLLSRLGRNPNGFNLLMQSTASAVGTGGTAATGGDVSSLDLGHLGVGETVPGSDAAADAVSDSIRSLFNLTQQADVAKVAKQTNVAKPPAAAVVRPALRKASPPKAKAKAAVAAPVTKKSSELKAKVVAARAPAKVSAPKQAVKLAPRKDSVRKATLANVQHPSPSQSHATVAETKKTAPVAAVTHAPKMSKPHKQVVVARAAPKKTSAVSVTLAPKQASKHIAPVAVVKPRQALVKPRRAAKVHTTKAAKISKVIAAKAPVKTSNGDVKPLSHVQSVAHRAELDEISEQNMLVRRAREAEARRVKEEEARRERELENEVSALKAQLATTMPPAKVSVPEVKEVKKLAVAQAKTKVVEAVRLPHVTQAAAAQAPKVLTTTEMTMTMVPQAAAVPQSNADETPPGGSVSFFGSIGHWFHTLFFGPDPVPAPVPTLPPPLPDPDAGRPPFSRQDVEKNAVSAHDDGLSDMAIEDDWSNKEQEDISFIDRMKREDRAIRLDAETPRKPSLPAPSNYRHDSGSTHISNFWGTLAEEDADIESALEQDGDDLSEYERLKKLQDAKVVASVSEISGAVGDHLALERRRHLRTSP